MESQDTITKTISKEKNKTGGIMCPDLKLQCKAIVIKQTVDQNKSETNPHLYGQLVYGKGTRIKSEEKSNFNK